MADKTGINWADSTFNPWIGCTKVSPACDNCYAEREWQDRRHVVNWGPGAPRKRTSAANWRNPIRWNEKAFAQCDACRWRGESPFAGLGDECPNCGEGLRPARRRVFCASLADVFDNEVDTQWRADLFALIESTPNLDWLLLTKRIGNVGRMIPDRWSVTLPSNIWLGATVCNQAEADRDIPKLLAIKTLGIRFLSIEPMLGPITLTSEVSIPPDENGPWRVGYMAGPDDGKTSLSVSREEALKDAINWVICGGESGPNARPMHPKWVRNLRNQCAAAGVPVLFKQWGEWVPRSECYHTFADGKSCVDLDPGSTKWPCIRLTERGMNGRDLANSVGAGDEAYMQRVGVKMAGRLLDGREHNGFPHPADSGKGGTA